jgi:hypothetical protein
MTKPKASNPDEESVGDARIDEAYALLKDGAPMRIKVGGQWATVTPHPYALLFPIVTREEFDALVADVAKHGFQHFPHLRDPDPRATTASTFSYGGDLEVVEGRHRVATAYALSKNISCEKFVGTDEDARVLVVSSNLHRRHLTKAQEALVVCETFLPIAKAEAEERHREGSAKGGKATATGREPSEGEEATATGRHPSAAEEASRMSGGLVGSRSVERMQIVTREDTPVTHERVWSGQTSSVLAAYKEAKAEIDEREAAAAAAAKAAAEPEEETPGLTEAPRLPRIVGIGNGLEKAAASIFKDIEKLRAGMRPLASADDQRELLIAIQSMLAEWFHILDRDDEDSTPAPPGEAF